VGRGPKGCSYWELPNVPENLVRGDSNVAPSKENLKKKN